nr:MAG: hypothetical protein [Microvirus sp.]
MAKRKGRRTGQRDRSRIATHGAAPSLNDFDENWLRNVRENTRSRYIDLTNSVDRRRWHPDNKRYPDTPWGYGELSPRVVIVPEGHRLSKYQTYGGRHSLRAVLNRWPTKQKRTARAIGRVSDWPYGAVRGSARYLFKGRHPGVHLPWQVVVCVRRERRRQVMFATKSTGKGARSNRRYSRQSNVRC